MAGFFVDSLLIFIFIQFYCSEAGFTGKSDITNDKFSRII